MLIDYSTLKWNKQSQKKNIRKLREKYNGINLVIPLNFELQTPQLKVLWLTASLEKNFSCIIHYVAGRLAGEA